METQIEQILKTTGDYLVDRKDINLLRFYKENKIHTTIYDLEIQNLLIEELRKVIPDSNFLAEEKRQTKYNLDNYTWIIDPIDGTENFVNGSSDYSISIALSLKSKIILGAIYVPESGDFYFAERNRGSRLNGHFIEVSKKTKITSSIIYSSAFETFEKNNEGFKYNNISKSISNLRVNKSTALEMCLVARGAAEARILANAKIWDIAAASLIVEEAKGLVTNWSGNSSYLFDNKIIASNELVHNELLSKVSNEY